MLLQPIFIDCFGHLAILVSIHLLYKIPDHKLYGTYVEFI